MAADQINDDMIRQLIATLGASVHHANQNLASLAQGLWQSQQNLVYVTTHMYQGLTNIAQAIRGAPAGGWSSESRGNQEGYRELKPKKDMTKVTAQDAKTLMVELAQFEVDLGELGVAVASEAAYRQLRAMAEGKAKEVVDLETVRGQGEALKLQLKSPGKHTWPSGPQRPRWWTLVCILGQRNAARGPTDPCPASADCRVHLCRGRHAR